MNETTCSRCFRDTIYLYGIERDRDEDPRYRYHQMVEWNGDKKVQSGPYCHHCGCDRQKELKQQSRRSAKRKIAQEQKVNVERDDCALVAMAAVTGRAYSAVQKAARFVGYRPGCGGMNFLQQELMAEQLGFRLVPVFSSGGGRCRTTVEDLLRSGRGKVYTRTLGHAFTVDCDEQKVYNVYGNVTVISAHYAEKIR